MSNIDIIVGVVDNATKSLNAVTRSIESLEKRVGSMQASMESGFENVSSSTQKLDKDIKDTAKSTHQMGGALMQMAFSALFIGYALTSVATRGLRAMTNTMIEVGHKTSEFNMKVNQLSARFTYLKWTLGQAFINSGAMDKWINRIEKFTDWVDGLSDETKSMAVEWGIWAAIIGVGLVIFGQLGTAIQAFGPMVKAVLKPVGALFTTLFKTKMWKVFSLHAKLIIWRIGQVTKVWLASFAKKAIAVLAAYWPILVLIAAFGLIVYGIWYVYNNWDDVWTGIKSITFVVIRGIADFFDWMINGIIDGLNWLLDMADSVAARIPGVGGVGFRFNRVTLFEDIGTAMNNQIYELSMEKERRNQGQQVTNNNDISVNLSGITDFNVNDIMEEIEKEQLLQNGSAT